MAKGGFRSSSRPGGGGVNMNMIKQAQKMQADMLKAQAETEEKEFTSTSGGGVVTATVNGKHEILSLKILPDAVDPQDVEILEDMITAAVNEAMRLADQEMNNNMSKFTAGLNFGI